MANTIGLNRAHLVIVPFQKTSTKIPELLQENLPTHILLGSEPAVWDAVLIPPPSRSSAPGDPPTPVQKIEKEKSQPWETQA